LLVDHGDFVGHLHIQSAYKVRVAMDSGLLNAHGFEGTVFERAINHRVTKLVRVPGLPLEIDVPLEGFGAQVIRYGERSRLGGGRPGLVVDADLVDDQRMRCVIGFALGEVDRVQHLRVEGMNRFGCEALQRDSNARPFFSGQTTGKLAKRHARREIVVVVGELDLRQIGGGNALVGVAPERQHVATVIGRTVVVAHHADFRVPTSAFDGTPFHSKRVGGRVESACIDRQAAVWRHERARSNGASASIEVIIGSRAIGEDQVIQVVILGQRTRGQNKQGKNYKAAKRINHGTSLKKHRTTNRTLGPALPCAHALNSVYWIAESYRGIFSRHVEKFILLCLQDHNCRITNGA